MRRLAITLCLLSFAASGRLQAQHEWAREDPAKIQTAETCGECHVSAYEVWKRTPHATGFKTLHRLKTAEAIAGRMGFKLIKRDSKCLQCQDRRRARSRARDRLLPFVPLRGNGGRGDHRP